MANDRRPYTPAQELSLTTQVGGHCPRCHEPLFYRKKGQDYKDYQLAHIYPLNPRPEELIELKDVELLSADVNDPDNIIPLCTRCHNRFDKPRTLEEYNELVELKRDLIQQAAQRVLFSKYQLKDSMRTIILKLNDLAPVAEGAPDVSYDAKSLDTKFDDSMPVLTRTKIRNAVTGFYPGVRREFRDLELLSPNASALIYAQVRAFYWEQKQLNLPQVAVFRNVVAWIQHAAPTNDADAAEVIASFFVQNCEVLE